MSGSRVVGHVRVEQRAKGRVWVAEITRSDGTRTRKTLGPAWVKDTGRRTPRGATVWRAAAGSKPDGTYLTPRDADDELRAILEVERKATPAPRPSRAKTWGDACDGWLERAATLRGNEPTTLRNYRSIVSVLEGDGLPRALPLRQVTDRRLEKVQADMLKRVDPKLPRASTRKLKPGEKAPTTRLSRKTIANRMLAIHGVLEYAKGRGWIGENPMSAMEVVHAPAPSVDFNVLEPSQVEAVARSIEQVPSDEIPVDGDGQVDDELLELARGVRQMYADAVRVLAYTGIRLGEIRALRWTDVDFAGQVLRVVENDPSSAPAGSEVKPPKGKKGRSTPLIAPAVAALDRLSKRATSREPTALVLEGPNRAPVDGGKLRDAFYDGLEGADLGHLRKRKEPIVLHDLRHTFGTIAVRVFPVTDVQAFLGHKNIETTMRYVHHVPRPDAAAKLTAAFALDLGQLPDPVDAAASSR